MSRETEKSLKELNNFLDGNIREGMSKEDIDSLINSFMAAQNGMPRQEVTADTASTSDDYYELAEKSKSTAEALKYAKKALELDPNNLDALSLSINISSSDIIDRLKRYGDAVKRGNEVMKNGGHFENDRGHFWGVLETRPYMRLRDSYADILVACGMYGKAISEYEEMLDLCENDNLGCRQNLMCLYAMMEKEDEAIALKKRYDGEDTRMLFPLSVLYFRKGNLDKAEEYLKRLCKANKDTKKFIKTYLDGRMEREVNKISGYGYRPFTIEEYAAIYMESGYIIEYNRGYFLWAQKLL